MKAYQSEARRQILRDPAGRKSLRVFLENVALRQESAASGERPTDVVVTSSGHRFSVRLVPTR